MALGSIKSSTQDNSSGTPVALGVNEDSGTNALQAMIQVGNKTTWSETSRTSLTGADAPTGGDMTTTGFAGSAGANLFDLGNALSCMVRATCDTASASLSGFLALYDGSNACLGKTEVISFNSDATLRLGNASGNFIAQRFLLDVGRARKAEFFVTAVSAGTWAVYCTPV